MAEIHKYGEWFYGADRVMTIVGGQSGGLDEIAYLFGLPIPYVDTRNNDYEFTLEELNKEGYSANDFFSWTIKVELGEVSGTYIICDIPDNFAFYIGNEDGDPLDVNEDEVFSIHWSKR